MEIPQLASLPLLALIGLRIFATSAHLFAPRWASRFIGMDATGTAGIVYARMFAIRNALLVAGLWHLDSFTDPKVFVALNVLVDAVDAVAFLAAGQKKDISARSAGTGTGIALTATALGALVFLVHPTL